MYYDSIIERKYNNMKKQRPTSPHITIYKLQMNMVASMMHRLTGIALFFASIIFPWIVLFYNFGCKDCINNLLAVSMDCVITKLALFCLSFALIYHACNGFRHLFYDVGYGFSIKVTNITGWIVVIASIIINITLWMFFI
jgi:succinate dehydrogenase / fumarate reductase cytochrome b subunit